MVSAQTSEHGQARWEPNSRRSRLVNPDVDARFEIRNIHAVDALLDTAGTASLIVVGRHGKGAIAAKLMGSVTHGVVGNAPVSGGDSRRLECGDFRCWLYRHPRVADAAVPRSSTW